jgi:RND superfamily putative drug exporter
MNIKLGQVDDRILPSTNRVVVASDQVRTRFDGREGSPVEILAQNASEAQVLGYAQNLVADERVTRVQTDLGIVTKGGLLPGTAQMFTGYKKASWQRLAVIATVEPRSPAGEKLVTDLRAIDSHIPGVLIGGSAAIYTDALNGISRQLPWAATWIVICVLIILFLFTGSVLLPIKAVLLNFMSLLATMGFLTWVFMSGNLKWLIGDFVVTGTIDSSSLVLVAVMSFGLSMDYELFLLSRIKEQHDHGLSTTESVAQGLQKSGRIITTAALVLAASFAAFATSSVSIMKMLGLGIAFAVIIDATVIRALLVPALMKLFGKANWWAPKWLRKVHDKIGLQD